jgi:hypothetical protein
MTWFLVMVAIWFLLARRRRRRWMMGHARFTRLGERHAWRQGRREHRARMRGAIPRDLELVRELPPTPAESRFEALKRRFVAGDLTDAEYEREVDALLRQPGGMNEVSR